jgi:LPS-assembly protein
LLNRRIIARNLLLSLASMALWPHAARAQTLSSLVHSEHQAPLQVTGNNLVYDYKTNTFIVTGNAKVTQQASILTAAEIDLERGQRKLHARGNVHLVDPLTEIRAKEAYLDLAQETAELKDASITNFNKTYRIKGARIKKTTGQHYSVQNGEFTTCGAEPGTPDWSISADQMNIQMGDSATAQNVHFNVLGHPILYSPYATFPANSDRHSGFLTPREGESGLRGFQLLQPYYWAIDRSSDASVALDIETSQRVGGLAEYRLVTGPDNYFSIDGGFFNESLRSAQNRENDIIDTQIANPFIPVDRYDLFGMLRQHITDDLVVYGDAITVSDALLLRELNVWTLSTRAASGIFYPNQLQLLRNAMSDFGLLDTYQNGYFQFGGIYNQDLIQYEPFALQTLPQFIASGRKDLFGGLLYSDYDLTADYFYRRQGQSGLRLDLNPRVTLPWRLGDYLYGYGTLGLRETMYDTSGHQIDIIPVGQDGRLYNNELKLGPLAPGGFQSREMIYGSLGIASELERIYNLKWHPAAKLKHTIEPFINYTYVPNYNQDSLPLFDEIDRIDGRSLITYGVTSRIFLKLTPSPPQTGENQNQENEEQNEFAAHAFMARSFVNGSPVDEILQLTLMQAYDTSHAIALGSSRLSDLELNASAFPSSAVSVGGQFDYSPQTASIHYVDGYLGIQRPQWMSKSKISTNAALQLSYTYIGPGPGSIPGVNAGFSEFLSARAYYELFNRVGVLFAPSYDVATHQLVSTEYGLRLKPTCNCWAIDMGITNTINPSETQFQFQLSLGGIGSFGKSPFLGMPFPTRMPVLPTSYY